MTALTDKQLLGLYERMTDDVLTDDDPRRESILGEMREVVAAADAESAGQVVEWWGDWDMRGGARWDRSPTAWAAEYRRRAGRMAARAKR